MTRNQVAEWIGSTEGRFFSVEFIKRTTNELRQMLCRTGVTKHLKGGCAAYNTMDKGLCVVWDVEKQGYRSIPFDGITRVKIDGEWVPVE